MSFSPFRLFPLILLLPFFLATFSVGAERPATAVARDLVNAMGCRGCHVIGGNGGTLGPVLDKVGKRLSREELRRRLVDPRGSNPASSMPSYGHLQARQVNVLVDYLKGLK